MRAIVGPQVILSGSKTPPVDEPLVILISLPVSMFICFMFFSMCFTSVNKHKIYFPRLHIKYFRSHVKNCFHNYFHPSSLSVFAQKIYLMIYHCFPFNPALYLLSSVFHMQIFSQRKNCYSVNTSGRTLAIWKSFFSMKNRFMNFHLFLFFFK